MGMNFECLDPADIILVGILCPPTTFELVPTLKSHGRSIDLCCSFLSKTAWLICACQTELAVLDCPKSDQNEAE